VGCAQPLAVEPARLLVDDPIVALDSQTTMEVLDILDQLTARGITIVLVTHEKEVGARAERRILFRDGRIVEENP